MKTFRIVMITFFSVLALCLCALLWRWLSVGSAGNFMTSVEVDDCYSLVQEKEFAAEDIATLSVKYPNSADVLIYESADNTVTVKEYMNFTPTDNQLSKIELHGSTLVIEGKKRNFVSSFTFTGPHSYTEIYLPHDLAASLLVETVSGDVRSELSLVNYSEFTISTTSGDIIFPTVEAKKISASSTSGEIRLESAAGKSVMLSTTSGDIALEQLAGDSSVSSTSGEIRIGNADENIEASTVSGDIRLDNLNAPFRFSTTSGEITVNNGTGYGKAGTVSGDIRISLSEPNGDLTISTTSGEVNLSLPEAASFTLDFNSTSGSCNTFFDDVLSFNKKGNEAKGQYGENTGNKLDVSTVSGDLRITKFAQ